MFIKAIQFAAVVGTLLALCAGSLRAADSVDGVPCDKVLAMSVDQWDAYYAKRHGGEETEVTERASLPLYAQCLRQHDDRAMKRLPTATAARICHYRTLTAKMHEDALILSRDYSGGGTMYIDFFAEAEVDDEQFIRRLIAGERTSSQRLSLGQIQSEIARIYRALGAHDPDDPRNAKAVSDVASFGSEFSRVQFKKDFVTLEWDFSRLESALYADHSADARAVLKYVRHMDAWLDAGE